MNFYSFFLKLCNENKEKPSPAAESIGLSRTAVNNWKNGGLPSDINLQKIADHFGVPFSEFLKCEDIARKHNIPIENKIEKTATRNGDGSADNMDDYALSVFRKLNFENKILAINELLSRLQDQSTQGDL